MRKIRSACGQCNQFWLEEDESKRKTGSNQITWFAYYIALKGRPFTDFKDLIDLEKLHGVKFQSGA